LAGRESRGDREQKGSRSRSIHDFLPQVPAGAGNCTTNPVPPQSGSRRPAGRGIIRRMSAAPSPKFLDEPWPSLPLSEWKDTYATLHRYTQIIGKVSLALAPRVNHWWGVAFHVDATGLTTSSI